MLTTFPIIDMNSQESYTLQLHCGILFNLPSHTLHDTTNGVVQYTSYRCWVWLGMSAAKTGSGFRLDKIIANSKEKNSSELSVINFRFADTRYKT